MKAANENGDDEELMRRIREKDLPRHMETPENETKDAQESDSVTQETEQWLEQDNQVRRALELLEELQDHGSDDLLGGCPKRGG